MRHHHLKTLSKTPAAAQTDNLIVKLEGTALWLQYLVLIPRTAPFKDIWFPDDPTGGTGGTNTGTGTNTP